MTTGEVEKGHTQVWDIEKGSGSSCEEHKQLIQDIVWDHEGKVWATSSKDKKLRLGDPRSKSRSWERSTRPTRAPSRRNYRSWAASTGSAPWASRNKASARSSSGT